MSKLAALACVLLLAVAATATPLTTFGRRPARQESNPDRDVEVVEPVNTGAGSSRGRLAPPESAEGAASDESSDELPFAFGIPVRRIGGFGGLSGIGLGARPILVRPLGVHPVLAARDDSDQASSEEDAGFIRPYLTDPMANFMAEMAEMMAAMRRQMAEVLSRGGGSSRDDVPDFTKLGNTTSTTKFAHRFSPPAGARRPAASPAVSPAAGLLAGLLPGLLPPRHFPLLPPPASAPASSVTWRRVVRPQVIDGHVITVNETVVEGDGDAPDLHIRVIDVHPSEAPESAEGDKAAVPDRAGQDDAKDAESVESAASSDSEAVTPAADRSENEIPMKVGSEVDDLNAKATPGPRGPAAPLRLRPVGE